MIFAAANPDPVALYQTLVTVQFLLGIFVAVLAVVTFFRNKAQKRDVTIVSEGVSKKQFDEHAAARDRQFNDHVKANNEMFEQIGKDASERRRLIYEKIESTRKDLGDRIVGVGNQVAGLETGQEMINQRVIEIGGKLDRAIERSKS